VNAWGINFALRYLLLFCAATVVVACGGSLCGNDVIKESVSPDGKYVASVIERNCGATTPYVQVISLRLSNTKLDPEKHDDWVFTIHGQSKIELNWESTRKLNISYSGTGDNPTQRVSWQDVAISYN
jgi:hypothetical protein